MVVDNNTAPNYFRLSFEDNEDFKALLKKGRETAEEEGLNDEDKVIQIYNEDLICEEFYFDESTNDLHISFSNSLMSSTISINLSDKVLIDILQHSVKKFNKLKQVLESLK